ncbi:15940_t:CDS:2 [Rhizophagus irregularis]|nr:15940_t:CDS:2 [Rhizophagus irregularis]
MPEKTEDSNKKKERKSSTNERRYRCDQICKDSQRRAEEDKNTPNLPEWYIALPSDSAVSFSKGVQDAKASPKKKAEMEEITRGRKITEMDKSKSDETGNASSVRYSPFAQGHMNRASLRNIIDSEGHHNRFLLDVSQESCKN